MITSNRSTLSGRSGYRMRRLTFSKLFNTKRSNSNRISLGIRTVERDLCFRSVPARQLLHTETKRDREHTASIDQKHLLGTYRHRLNMS